MGQRVGDSERLGVGESVGHGDVGECGSWRRESQRVSAEGESRGESEARWKRAIFSNPTHAERQRRVRGVWRMSMPMRFGDALLPHQPDRALLTSSPIAVVTESDRASGHVFSYPPTASGGTRIDADAPRSAAAEALLLYI